VWKNIEWKNNPKPLEINNGTKVGVVHLFPVFFPNQWNISLLLEVYDLEKSDFSVYRRYHPTVSEMGAEEQQFPYMNQGR